MTDESDHSELLSYTAEIVSSHLSNNKLSEDEIAKLIERVYRTLTTLNKETVSNQEKPQPAVPVKKSLMPDYIICLEDGKKLKMLKRHLKTAYNMTPEEYKEKWDLPADYPMVAPNYAKHRSRLAKDIGLGTKSGRESKKTK